MTDSEQPIAVIPPAGPLAGGPAGNPAAAEAKIDSPTDIIHFEKWLATVGERKASDLHLTVGSAPVLRIDGAIAPIDGEDIVTAERMQRIVERILDADEQAVLAKEKEVITSRTLKKTMRFRIHVFYGRGYLAASLRHLPGAEPAAGDLGLPEAVAAMGREAAGLLLITGPFDSGKTATVRALLAEINHRQARYIITLERPIEYLLSADKGVVVQRQIGRDVPDFAAGLAALQNEDVNVAAVSDLPDAAAALEALKLATSGRLVLAVLGGRAAASALETLRDLFPPKDQERVLNLLADGLLGVASQLLLPKIAGGRALITEVLLATAPVKALIREGKLRQIPQIMQTSREQGMVTMDRALADAVKSGIIALQTARERAIDPNQFNLMVSH